VGSLQGIFYFLGERNFNGQTPGVANASINGALILRPYGTFSHPNVLGGFLVIATIWFLSCKSLLNKYFVISVFAIATFGILLSFSRTALLTWLMLSLLFFGAALVEKYQKVKINSKVLNYKNIFITITILIFFVIFLNSIFGQRLTKFSLTEESLYQREKLIKESVRLISQNPVFGVGVNNFINNLNPSFNSPLLLQPVHNIFLLTFAQTGIIGIFILIFLMARGALISLMPKINIYKMATLLAVLFIGMLDHYFLTLQQGQILLVLVLAYTLSRAE
jgi:O-antigen ligase